MKGEFTEIAINMQFVESDLFFDPLRHKTYLLVGLPSPSRPFKYKMLHEGKVIGLAKHTMAYAGILIQDREGLIPEVVKRYPGSYVTQDT